MYAAFMARGWVDSLGNWGYVGAFLINAISSAVILLPAPGIAILLVMAQDFHPFWLGVAAGLGGALGSSTSYIVGRLSAHAVHSNRFHRWTHRSMHRFGGPIVFGFALIPFLPTDIGGLMAGATKYSVPRYYLYSIAGNIIKMIAVFYVAVVYVDWFRNWIENNAPGLQWLANILSS